MSKVVGIPVPIEHESRWGDASIIVRANRLPVPTITHVRGWYGDGSPRWLWVDALVPDNYRRLVLFAAKGTRQTCSLDPIKEIDTSRFSPYVIDSVRGRCDFVVGSETVEQQDALRTVTLAEGRHMDGGHMVSRARIRYEKTRESDVVYITHQWICSTDDIALTEIGVECPSGTNVIIKDMARSGPAAVDGTTAKLWTGSVLDYRHPTMIDDGWWPADYIAAQEPAVGLTESEIRAVESPVSGSARTHKIGVSFGEEMPSWGPPLRLRPSWVRKQKADVAGAVAGESVLADSVVEAYIEELDAHDGAVQDIKTGWYHDGHPPQLRHHDDGNRAIPEMFRGHNVLTYDLAYYLGLAWMRGYSAAWDRFDRYSRAILDYYITWGGDLPGTWIGGDEAPIPDCWVYRRVNLGAEARVVPPTEIGRPEMALLLRWWLTGDRFAMDAIKASANAFIRYFNTMPLWIPYQNDPPTNDDYINTQRHTLGHHNRLTHITRFAVLAQALRNKLPEIRNLTRDMYNTFIDPDGPLGLRQQVWDDGPFSWATIRYKIQGKIRDLLDLWDTFGWHDAKLGALDALDYYYIDDTSTWRNRVDGYQPLDSYVLRRLRRFASSEDRLRIDGWLSTDREEWSSKMVTRADDDAPDIRWAKYRSNGWVANQFLDPEFRVSARPETCAGWLIGAGACA